MNSIEVLVRDKRFFRRHLLENGESVVDYFSETLKNYVTAIRSAEADNSIVAYLKGNIELIDSISAGIIETTKTYLAGRPSAAYQIFDQAMEKIWSHLQVQKTEIREIKRLYRCRSVSREETIDDQSILHVPFHLRHLIGNQRYSINGFPSLYLSESIYGCLRELKYRETRKWIAGRYVLINEQPRVLDLAIDFSIIKKSISPAERAAPFWNAWIDDGVRNKLILLPLILAVSVGSRKTSTFKAEYIIPQLLLEWVRSNSKVDCIRYHSTINFGNIHTTELMTNYVFPVKSNLSTGHCPILNGFFNISSPKEIPQMAIRGLKVANFSKNYFSTNVGLFEKTFEVL